MRRLSIGLAAALMVVVVAGVGPLEAKAAKEAKLTEKQLDEARTFMVNNAIFTLFHEAGHMLISEFGLPVLGREEDAVDALSSILLLEADVEELDVAMQDAADGWFLSDEAREEDLNETDFLDTHGLDRQRAYAIVCMMVGADAKYFENFADSLDFPRERREECEGEYQHAKDSWFSLLEPHQAEEGKGKPLNVSYEPADNPDVQIFADMLKEASVLELVSEGIGTSYKFDDGIKLTAKSCGVVNAFWNPQAREITYCYELAVQHLMLIDGYFKREKGKN
ncbi:DUF4344 domain-containing metallopeptidase [Rhizobium sp. S95]|uniref:DUF4344 domain-containing metallopeptidase n=1 Tax=Ciceribacter sichuanensis TaxID=2949647 RepID=A0AAJ1BU57_9HYPH|nr:MULTISPECIES: DUF4344 domain-containing metallopeptidase [unclassified Ciceribacter]MCM2397527.1 DUF4344 domain-containing metallopeptidase [Ciceribacter sp. S95]MCO5956176.1 DUF4344 domain-containing metallopeptidase [Ciceribacter sp. S101]